MRKAVRICLVGGGRAGKVHASTITRHLPGAQLTTLVETVGEVGKETARLFGIQSLHASFEAALESEQFEAVVITTPTFTHRDLAVMAASMGKHIFLEKPMALTLAECDEIISAVEKGNVLMQLGFMRRFDPEFVAAARRIQTGEIGRPMMIKSLTHGPGLPPPWARDLRRSNGMLAEVNSHDWDCVRWLMGSNYSRVYSEVADFKGKSHGVTEVDFYDNALVNIRFENGGLGSISGICPCGYGYDARVEIVGERGILQIGQLQGQAVVIGTDREMGLITPVYRTWPERFTWAYLYEMEHFVECIHSDTQPRVSGEDGRWAVAGVLAATRSFMEGRPVSIQEVF